MPRLSCVPSPAASCAEGPTRGLREITRAQWDTILTAARCTILNSMSNDKCDSYVLSESSLFVYSHKMVLKTCGTTTLLMALEPLLEITTSLGMVIEWLAYTRKDFIFPQVQKFPHRAPQEEVRTGAGGWPDPRNQSRGRCQIRVLIKPSVCAQSRSYSPTPAAPRDFGRRRPSLRRCSRRAKRT
jgi:hypothetical protein